MLATQNNVQNGAPTRHGVNISRIVGDSADIDGLCWWSARGYKDELSASAHQYYWAVAGGVSTSIYLGEKRLGNVIQCEPSGIRMSDCISIFFEKLLDARAVPFLLCIHPLCSLLLSLPLTFSLLHL
jgi:hypothetical protein